MRARALARTTVALVLAAVAFAEAAVIGWSVRRMWEPVGAEPLHGTQKPLHGWGPWDPPGRPRADLVDYARVRAAWIDLDFAARTRGMLPTRRPGERPGEQVESRQLPEAADPGEGG